MSRKTAVQGTLVFGCLGFQGAQVAAQAERDPLAQARRGFTRTGRFILQKVNERRNRVAVTDLTEQGKGDGADGRAFIVESCKQWLHGSLTHFQNGSTQSVAIFPMPSNEFPNHAGVNAVHRVPACCFNCMAYPAA